MTERGRTVQIRKQVRLGFARTVEVCVNGIYYRLFRSLVTVAIVSVAVAFMMYMLTGGLVGRSVHRAARVEATAYKVYGRWLSWMEKPMNRTALLRSIGQCEEGDPKVKSIEHWGKLSPTDTAALLAVSREAREYLGFFESLPPGRRFLVAEGMGSGEFFDRLRAEDALDRFAERLATLGTVRCRDVLRTCAR